MIQDIKSKYVAGFKKYKPTGTYEELKEKLVILKKEQEKVKEKIKILEDYAITNHHKWSRKKIFQESQKLTDVNIVLDEMEYKQERLEIEIGRREKAKKKLGTMDTKRKRTIKRE